MNSQPEFAKLLHDLRNQLNNISMNAELARMEVDATSNPPDQASSATTVMECLNTIVDACAKCAKLADALIIPPVSVATVSSDQSESRGN